MKKISVIFSFSIDSHVDYFLISESDRSISRVAIARYLSQERFLFFSRS
ncbi:hypothetical protein [Oscillatoria salina]|nr:hypothetical protein [Oscillatoria salina]MBZ8179725.1 hypothetical protein [Oscillatoria salina IIICB1]NET87173.1 hypothetical protein [Kamptonema sp. SIO1D9]